ncbi:mandelate racemase/muconate lactonizing enzyme family protein [Ornithinibacillus halotolerans]|uniref:Dipeptide epimerase n=1 Tax=Ornithinibacillus halotolerans TaxID=1274357 RepID=A0A916RPK2_9BACI|nr:dipeptide epimerase [Ornithinibacillus halotolerans]GGA64420.1 L-Ala-D/L-Glu epimerase [Ornithinibacillus halotolerans]
MKIKQIETYKAAIPLKKAFKTALRTVTVAETIVVKVTCENGVVGYGEAPPTHVITGDTLASISYTINHVLSPCLLGLSILEREQIFENLQRVIVGNPSAKAAMDMAIYDCIAQASGLSLTHFLGGYHKQIETDYTVSVNEPGEMADDAAAYVADGFHVLKVKVGKDQIEKDIERIQAIRESVGPEVTIRLDANQGWNPKEAVRAIHQMEDSGLNIEFIEQPVKADDLAGLKYVTTHTEIPIMADESVFSAKDARQVLEMGAADLINIKLMKAGGIHEALKIAKLASAYDVKCMVGSMIESKIGITAAAHFAASQPNVHYFDFDAPLMLAGDLIKGGITYSKSTIYCNDAPGLGITQLNDEYIVS